VDRTASTGKNSYNIHNYKKTKDKNERPHLTMNTLQKSGKHFVPPSFQFVGRRPTTRSGPSIRAVWGKVLSCEQKSLAPLSGLPGLSFPSLPPLRKLVGFYVEEKSNYAAFRVIDFLHTPNSKARQEEKFHK
jgi:hypothetical protein